MFSLNFALKRDIPCSSLLSQPFFIYNVGSGGTRYHVVTQKLKTAGFFLKIKDLFLYVDPGISSYLSALEAGVPIEKISHIFVSHSHIDHAHDLPGFIEGVYLLSHYQSKVNVICSTNVKEKYLDEYHLDLCESITLVDPSKKIVIEDIVLSFAPCVHHSPNTLGMVIQTPRMKIGYTSDTVFYSSFSSYYSGCDVLITHPCIIKHNKTTRNRHASKDDIINMVLSLSSSPSLILLRHLGFEILQYSLERFCKEIEKETGVKTIALLDRDAIIIEKSK